MKTATGYKARAILGPRDSVDTEDATLEGVLVKMTAALPERAAAVRSARVDGVPTAGEHLGTLHRLRLRGEFGVYIEKMLAALHKAPGQTLSAGDLARVAGWDSYEAVNTHLGTFAKLAALDVGFQPTETGPDGAPTWTFTLATEAPERSQEGHFRWKMRPQLAEALELWWGSHPTA
jgi:hypothetical protein